MELKRMLFWAVVGPVLLYLAFSLQATYCTFIASPKPLSVPEFPSDYPKELKEATIKGRKGLLKEHMEALAGRPSKNYLNNLVTDDVEFEDPLQIWQGKKNYQLLMAVGEALVKSLDYDVHGEYHAPHEIVMDWTMSFTMNFFGGYTIGPLQLYMRQHILLEPADQPGGQEKIFRIFEEWNGNELLSEQNSMFGAVHKNLRRLVGYQNMKMAEFFM